MSSTSSRQNAPFGSSPPKDSNPSSPPPAPPLPTNTTTPFRIEQDLVKKLKLAISYRSTNSSTPSTTSAINTTTTTATTSTASTATTTAAAANNNNSTTTTTISYQQILSDLVNLFQQNEHTSFTFPNAKKRQQTLRLLLQLWKHLLKVKDMLPYQERHVAYRLIICLMKRQEFDPIYFSSNNTNNTSTSVQMSNEDNESILKEYYQNCQQTLVEVLQKLLANSKQIILYHEMYSYCAGILALSMFRLTSHRDIFMEPFMTQFESKMLQMPPLHCLLFCQQMNFNPQMITEMLQMFTQHHHSTPFEQFSISHSIEQMVYTHLSLSQTDTSTTTTTHSVFLKQLFRYFDQFVQLYDTKKQCKNLIDLSPELNQILSSWQQVQTWMPSFYQSSEFFYVFICEYITQAKIIQSNYLDLKMDSIPFYSKLVVAYVQSLQNFNPLLFQSVPSTTTTTTTSLYNPLKYLTLQTQYMNQCNRFLQLPSHQCLYYHHLQNTNNAVEWNQIHSDLIEMKKYLMQYATWFMESQRKWLAASFILLKTNAMLLNLLVALFIPSTHVFALNSEVFPLLEYLDLWFNEYKTIHLDQMKYFFNNSKYPNHHLLYMMYHQNQNHTQQQQSSSSSQHSTHHVNIPQKFPIQLFTDMVDMLIETHHFQITVRVLILVYNVLDLFNRNNERMKLLYDCLLKKHFWELFLNWNDDTRTCFHRILIYKMKRYKKPNHVNEYLQKQIYSETNTPTTPITPISTTTASSGGGGGKKRTGSVGGGGSSLLAVVSGLFGKRTKNASNTTTTNSSGLKKDSKSTMSKKPPSRSFSADQISSLVVEPHPSASNSTTTTTATTHDPLTSNTSNTTTPSNEFVVEGLLLVDANTTNAKEENAMTEEALDTVLQSKAESLVEMVFVYDEKAVANMNMLDSSKRNKSIAFTQLETTVPLIPNHLKIYISKAKKEYKKILQEYSTWKQQLDQFLNNNMNNTQVVLLTMMNIPYPIIKFPAFNVKDGEFV